MASRTPRGLPLEEAFRHWTNPAELKWLDELKQYSSPPLAWFPGDPYIDWHHRWCERRQLLEEAFIKKLRTGELVAFGFEVPISATSARKIITPELWEVLEPDFENSQSFGAGLSIIMVEIVSKVDTPEPDPLKASINSIPPLDPVPSANTAPLRLSEDGSQLAIGDKVLTFRGEIQQSIIQQLMGAYERRIHLRTQEVLRRAGSNADSLAKAFSGSPNWTSLKSLIRQENGFCWFEPKQTPP